MCKHCRHCHFNLPPPQNPLSEVGGGDGAPTRSDSPGPTLQTPTEVEEERPPDPELERRLLEYLSELSLTLPIDSLAITNQLNSVCINICENLVTKCYMENLSVD